MRLARILLLWYLIVALIGCTRSIDGSTTASFRSSLDIIQKDLTDIEKDSLKKCMIAITQDSEIGLLDTLELLKMFDQKTSEDILKEGAEVFAIRRQKAIREKQIQDSIRAAYVQDSIKRYNEQGVWEIGYFVDEFQEETNDGYIVNYGTGTFSNSAATNARLDAKLLITNDYEAQLFLYEYGSQQVKSYSRSGEFYNIRLASGEERYNLEGLMTSDRIYIVDKRFFVYLKKGGYLKVYIEEQSKYGSPSTYLVELDVTNYSKAMNKLKSRN